jgi:hypothetical protein
MLITLKRILEEDDARILFEGETESGDTVHLHISNPGAKQAAVLVEAGKTVEFEVQS